MALKLFLTIIVAFLMYCWTNEVAAVNIDNCVTNPTGKVSLDIDVHGRCVQHEVEKVHVPLIR